MSKLHDNAIRYGDEYQCSTCGKSWAVDDNDVPECEIQLYDDKPSTELSMLKSQITGLKQMIVECAPPHDKRFNWTPKQWYNHLNISKLRDTINTHK